MLPLEVTEADFSFAGPNTVLHVPAAEAHAQQPPQRFPRRRVGHEGLLLPRGRATCTQSIPPPRGPGDGPKSASRSARRRPKPTPALPWPPTANPLPFGGADGN